MMFPIHVQELRSKEPNTSAQENKSLFYRRVETGEFNDLGLPHLKWCISQIHNYL